MLSNAKILSGAGWTVLGFGISQLLRLGANIVLARLLAPELFGFMVVVNTLRTGFELLSDFGIQHSIVQNKHADEPEFYNTAWTLQLTRGLILWVAFCAAALPAARFYGEPALVMIFPVAGLYFLSEGFCSLSGYVMQRHLYLRRLNFATLLVELVATSSAVVIALFQPTIWALVFGPLVGSAFRLVWSHRQLPGIQHRIQLSRVYLPVIMRFGGWIFVSSFIYFLSMSLDRLYLAKVASLGLVGIYGIARTFADMITAVVVRLCYLIVFPLASRFAETSREGLRTRIERIRLKAVLVAAILLGGATAFGDLPIKLLYDKRYEDAGWMVPVMIAGVWWSTLITLNEATVLALGKPVYGAIGNTVKLAVLVVFMPFAFSAWGVYGMLLIIAAGEGCRYCWILVGQRSLNIAFAKQDVLATACVIGSGVLFSIARWAVGFGTAFGKPPYE